MLDCRYMKVTCYMSLEYLSVCMLCGLGLMLNGSFDYRWYLFCYRHTMHKLTAWSNVDGITYP